MCLRMVDGSKPRAVCTQTFNVDFTCIHQLNFRHSSGFSLNNYIMVTQSAHFRYTGVTPAPPPGNTHTSPSEDYWAQVDLNGARQAVNLVNGVIVDGETLLPSHAYLLLQVWAMSVSTQAAPM